MILKDNFQREIHRIRIALTSDCNMNCIYCHHEGHKSSFSHNYLTIDQIRLLGSIVAKYGIEEIKLTGGEPLLHPDIFEIIQIFTQISTVKDVSITTNGLLLNGLASKLKEAGLHRINIGCDSINKSTVKSLDRIYASLKATKVAGFSPIKLNMVLLKGINDNDVEEMINFAQNEEIDLQIIELLNVDEDFYQKYHVPLDIVEENLKKRAIRINERQMHNRKQFYLTEHYYVETVRPGENEHFCEQCHTLRVTSVFQFQPCLNRDDNLVPIGNNIEDALKEAMNRRTPFYVRKC